jgi:DedD protein
MDRRVKERLIGATILVALIVLIVPELLSGPKLTPLLPLAAGLPGSTRNVSVNLATNKTTPEPQASDTAAASQGGAAPAARSSAPVGAPAAASSSQPSSEDVEGPQAGADAARGSGDTGSGAPAAGTPTVATLRAQPQAPLENSGSPPRSDGESARAAASEARAGVQNRRGWAVQLGSFASKANAEKLLHQLPGNAFYVVSSGSGPSLRYRVRMGPLADRGAAERAVTRLKALGHPATIVSPAS